MNEHVRESLKHWFRMRRWVRKVIKHKYHKSVDDVIMNKDLGECWAANYCALCGEYISYSFSYGFSYGFSCFLCPLHLNGDGCLSKDSSWYVVNVSTTWVEWLSASNEMIKALWEIRDYGI